MPGPLDPDIYCWLNTTGGLPFESSDGKSAYFGFKIFVNTCHTPLAPLLRNAGSCR